VSPVWLVWLCLPTRMVWLAPLLGFVLTLPSILSGSTQDDHVFRQNSLETISYPRRAAWDYFHWQASEPEIAQYRERGIQQVTWWTPDTARTLLVTPANGWFAASPMSRGARPKELVFKRDLSEFAWLQMVMQGPERFQVPAPGEELQVHSFF